MTSPHGNVSPQAPPRDQTRLICGSSAAAGSASTGDGGRGTKRGGEKKRKEPASHDSSKKWPSRKCDRTFTSKPAVNGHQRVHREKQEQQAESSNKDMKKAVSGAPVVPPWPRPGGKRSKRNMGVRNNQPRQQVQQWSETEGHGSAVAEGGPSSSEEAKKDKMKPVPRNFDLNQPPVDDGNGDEEAA